MSHLLEALLWAGYVALLILNARRPVQGGSQVAIDVRPFIGPGMVTVKGDHW